MIQPAKGGLITLLALLVAAPAIVRPTGLVPGSRFPIPDMHFWETPPKRPATCVYERRAWDEPRGPTPYTLTCPA